MDASRHAVRELAGRMVGAGPQYREFLRVESMSVGLYVLAPGATDDQTPHTEDEVYYVVSGHGRLRVGDRDIPATAGDLLYVPAGTEHRFVGIDERLELLVLFAPAEGTRSREGAGPGKG